MNQIDSSQNAPTKSLANQDVKVAENAYQRGDFKEARHRAETLLESDSLKENEQTRLQQILTAIAADPLATLAYGLTLFLMLFVSIKYLL